MCCWPLTLTNVVDEIDEILHEKYNDGHPLKPSNQINVTIKPINSPCITCLLSPPMHAFYIFYRAHCVKLVETKVLCFFFFPSSYTLRPWVEDIAQQCVEVGYPYKTSEGNSNWTLKS